MDDFFINIISVFLTTIILPIISMLLMNFVKKINSDNKNKTTSAILLGIQNIIINTVKAVTQTYVEELKREGKFNKEAQTIAIEKAKSQALAQMNEETLKFIKSNFGDVELWLVTQIESTINSIKANNK